MIDLSLSELKEVEVLKLTKILSEPRKKRSLSKKRIKKIRRKFNELRDRFFKS